MGAKIDSLLKLLSLQLNVPDIIVIRSQEELIKFLEKGMEWSGWERISIRTDTKREFENYRKWGLPFYPYKTREKTREILTRELFEQVGQNIDVIVAKGIDPQDTLLSGKYMRTNEDILEYVSGPSTVRTIESSIPKTWYVSRERIPKEFLFNFQAGEQSRIISTEILHLSYEINNVISRYFQVPFVVEFSIYPYPIGKLEKHLIFWEVIEPKKK